MDDATSSHGAEVFNDAVARLRAALGRGDRDEAARLITDRPIEIWFGMVPSEVHAIVSALPSGAVARDTVAGTLLLMASGESLEGRIGADPAWSAAFAVNDDLRRSYVFMQAIQTRVAGDPVLALEIMRPIVDVPIRSRLYRDRSGGLDGMVLLQAALSAALAGEVVQALAWYDRLLLAAPREPAFAFFAREAYIRSALIHGLFGDRADARGRLENARAVPRTSSWVESQLDVEEVLVDALLQPAQANREVVERVLAVPLQLVGELWPFYVSVLHRLTVATEFRARGRERLESLEAAGIARTHTTPTGLLRDTFPIAYAWDDLMAGKPVAAKVHLDVLDPDSVAVRLLFALHALASGSPARALQLARAAYEHTRGFVQLEAMRLIVMATAHFVARELDDAEAVLRDLEPLLDTYTASLLRGLSSEVVAFAEQRIGSWPSFEGAGVGRHPVGVFDTQLLTVRELDVLRALAQGKRRDEVAAALFLSVNTVKTHQQSLYRKLRVSSVNAAVTEGVRRGLV